MPPFRRRDASRGTKIFYATDVHGSERTWRKFLNAGAFYGADVLVMGGDVMGKLVFPIIRGAGGHHRATIHGRVEHLDTDADVEAALRSSSKPSSWHVLPSSKVGSLLPLYS